jgi:hypothetical protein
VSAVLIVEGKTRRQKQVKNGEGGDDQSLVQTSCSRGLGDDIRALEYESRWWGEKARRAGA